MDEMEEFLTVFFQECEERLGELQDNLAQLLEGDWDAETLNAAFRAVHSVKGGAGAFGLEELVKFTHVFETTMDALRAEKLEPNERVCQVLLRATDMMEALIEAAQGNGEADRDLAGRIAADLSALANGEEPSGDADDAPAKPAAETPAETAAAEPASPDASADAPGAAEDGEDDGPAEREVTLRIRPGPDFVRSGHDPLKLLRALQQFGATKVEADGDHPPLAEIDPLTVTLGWTVTLSTATPLAEIEAFLFIYTLTADIEIIDAAPEEEAAPAPEAASAEPTPVEPAPAEPAAPIQAAPEPAAEAPAAPAEHEAEPAPRMARGGGDSKAAQSAAAAQKSIKALRVELSRIDRLVNMVGEIVITQAVLSQNFTEVEGANDIQFGHAVEALSRQVRELQESVMAIRAQPVKSVFSRMPRVVRDLCASLDKEARVVLIGEQTEVDTTVIEELSEPLTHMLRNSMDHGVESPEKREAAGKPRCGTITLAAEHRGERVRIVVEDDGAGINRAKVLEKAIKNGVVSPDATLSDEEIDMLIFHPGFSTADAVTNVSGRGVGMDVVKKKVQSLGGRVSVVNRPGNGAQFIITLPLTLAVLDGMTIGVGEERFILPLSSVVEAVKLDARNIDVLPGDIRVLRYRGEWMPMICLPQALNLESARGNEELVVVVETETDGRVAILVDELLGQRQVVLKSLEANFKRVDGVSGATILGDGRVALILDIPALQALAGSSALARHSAPRIAAVDAEILGAAAL